MKSAVLITFLLSAIFAIQSSSSFAQILTNYNCPLKEPLPEDQGVLRAGTAKYLAAIKSNDWDTISKLSVASLATRAREGDPLTEFNQTQTLLQDLIHPGGIEVLSVGIQDVSLKPCEASVRYTLNLKVEDPTHQTTLALNDFRRSLVWKRFQCACPPTNTTEWKIAADVAEVEDLAKALAEAKTSIEQRLLLAGRGDYDLEEMVADWSEKGYEILSREPAAKAFSIFRSGQIVLSYLKDRERVVKLAALREAEKDLAKARETKDSEAEAALLYAMGNLCLDLREYDRALKCFNESLTKTGSMADGARIYKKLGGVSNEQGDYGTAVGYYLKSAERFKWLAQQGVEHNRVEFVREFLDLLQEFASAYEAQGKDDLAERALDEILRVANGIDEEALLFLKIGAFHEANGNITKAIRNFEKSLSLTKRIETHGEPDLLARQDLLVGPLELSLTELYLKQGDYNKAAARLVELRYGLKGDEEPDELDESPNYLFSAYESMFYGAQGDEPLATFHLQQMTSSVGDLGLVAMREQRGKLNTPLAASIEQLGKGNWKKAREDLSLVLELAKADGDEFLASFAYVLFGETYRAENGNERATLENYNKSLQTVEGMSFTSEVSRNDLQEWILLLRIEIGRIHASLGDYDNALNSYRKALEHKSGPLYKQNGLYILYLAATAYFNQGQLTKALSAITEAVTLANRTGNRADLWAIYTLAGTIYRASKEPRLAARYFDRAISETEASRHKIVGGEQAAERFFENRLTPYHEMMAMLVEQNKCSEALSYAEQSKSRVLLDVLQSGGNDVSASLTSEESEHRQLHNSRRISAEREYELARSENPDSEQTKNLKLKRAQARFAFDAYRARLLLRYSKPNQFRKAVPQTISPAEIGGLLNSTDKALLEFAVTADKTYVFTLIRQAALTPTSKSSVRCDVRTIPVKVEELMQPARELAQHLAHPDGIVRPFARQMYDLLLKPIENKLAGKTTLVIIPDRILWTVPFQALQQSNNHYLLEDYVISYAPSLLSLNKMKTRARGPGNSKSPSEASRTMRTGKGPRLLVLANPAVLADAAHPLESPARFDPLSPLLLTEAQAARLAQLYGLGKSKVYVGTEANEESFKNESRNYDVIHIGAHAILDNDGPLYSRVLLARTKMPNAESGEVGAENNSATSDSAESETAQDGLLEAWEIMNLELNADLVVLSACETARGRVADGEGIVGLSWALLLAGVPSTVVSQWQVDEGATVELLYVFHENLLRNRSEFTNRATKADALRQASLKLINSQKYKHPYYWAGFILVGDGG